MSEADIHSKVKSTINRLKCIVEKEIQSQNYNCAMAAIVAGCGILYSWNQYYVDEDFENYTKEIAKVLVKIDKAQWQNNREKAVLFYDSFGLDTRGLALIYLKAILASGYKLIYVTDICGKGQQQEIDKVLLFGNVIKIYVDGNNINRIRQLNNIFEQYHPTDAFFYTTPNDVPATAVFDAYTGLITRYQINLTDHAFWLGKYAFDYCIEFRDYGYYVSKEYRKIPKDKLIILPYYPIVDKTQKFQGWNFEVGAKRVVFSGGSLYKTLGDPENRYYKIVDHILQKHDDIIFVYAGSGDASALNKLISKYPERVYHIAERTDLLQVLQNSVLYLNTFPMGGGLMMQYAVIVGKLPLTLIQDEDMSGILINQDKLGIEYDDYNYMMQDIDKLLTDTDYLRSRENRLIDSVISEQKFQKNVKLLLENNKTEFVYNNVIFNTTGFRKTYVNRFDKRILEQCIANRKTLALIKHFPLLFFKGALRKLKGNLCK